MIEEAQKKKSEIESHLEEVEIKQDVLLYYQLLDFRHEPNANLFEIKRR